MKEMVADFVPTYHIREEDKERDRKKIDEKYQQIYSAAEESMNGSRNK